MIGARLVTSKLSTLAARRSADIPVCRIAGLSSLPRSAFVAVAADCSKLADRNVGDTADKNVCATYRARNSRAGMPALG